MEWSLDNEILYYQGKIYVPSSDLQCCITALCHDSKIASHAGRWKTLELVSQKYWWPQMSRYIGRYIFTCDMCLCTKPSHNPLTRELHLLPILDAPWDTISVDFIVELLESEEKDVVMVVVDSITKQAHFVDTVTTLSPQQEQRNCMSNTSGSTMGYPEKLTWTEDHSLLQSS
jgi:hypothetical protein